MRRTTGSTRAVFTAPRRSNVSISTSAASLPRPKVFTCFIEKTPEKSVGAIATFPAKSSYLQHNLTQRILYNSRRSSRLQLRNHLAHQRLIQNRIQSHPLDIAQLRNGRRVQRRQYADHHLQVGLSRIQHQADSSLRRNRRIQHQRNVVDLLALPLILVSTLICDQLRLTLHQRLDNPQPIRPQRRSRLRNLDNCIRQRRRFHLRRAPAELHRHRNIFSCKISLRKLDQFGRNNLSRQVLRLLKRRVLWHCKHPLHLLPALLGVSKTRHVLHVRLVLQNPVIPSQSGIERTMLNVPRHLLCPHQHALNLRVIDGREVASPIREDPPTRSFKQRNRCILQAALRNSQL